VGDIGPDQGAESPWEAFGAYLRSQRQLARLSLRQLASLTRVSNPYLSQIERGLHQPSVTVIKSLADALDMSAEHLLAQAAGIADAKPSESPTEAGIRADDRLSRSQKDALLAVYRSMVDDGVRPGPDGSAPSRRPSGSKRSATPPGRAASERKAPPTRRTGPRAASPQPPRGRSER
jgi:transcriptional regulator with XRE-family HTH domain